jgi:hypothetical protein
MCSVFYDKSVALNVGYKLSNLTGNTIEGSGRALIWDNVPVIFLEELRKISWKVIYYSWSPYRTLNLRSSRIENMIATYLLVTDENS